MHHYWRKQFSFTKRSHCNSLLQPIQNWTVRFRVFLQMSEFLFWIGRTSKENYSLACYRWIVVECLSLLVYFKKIHERNLGIVDYKNTNRSTVRHKINLRNSTVKCKITSANTSQLIWKVYHCYLHSKTVWNFENTTKPKSPYVTNNISYISNLYKHSNSH